MAGRPKTMARKVRRLLERHDKLGDDLYQLMPKQYVPDPAKGERWDSEFTEAEGSLLACNWRKTIHDFACCHEWLVSLTALLMMKANESEPNTTPDEAAEDSDDVDDDDHGQNEPEAGQEAADSENGQGKLTETDGTQDAAADSVKLAEPVAGKMPPS